MLRKDFPCKGGRRVGGEFGGKGAQGAGGKGQIMWGLTAYSFFNDFGF